MKSNPLTKNAAFAVVAAFLVLMSVLVMAQPAHAAGCANEAIRAEQGTAAQALPDCRAYELVSPGGTPAVQSSGGGLSLIGGAPVGARAADDGNAMAYQSFYPFQGASTSGAFFRSRRGGAGWSLEGMVPQVVPGTVPAVNCELEELDYSDDLSASVLTIGRDPSEAFPGAPFCTQPQEVLAPGEPLGFANLLRRGNVGAPYELVNQAPSGASPANAQFQDASRDLSRIVFGEAAQLTPEAPPGYNLYLWAGGSVRLVSLLPDGTPVRGDLAGATGHAVAEERPGGGFIEKRLGGAFLGTAPFTNAVSSDGERIYFYAQGNLYLRENAAQSSAANSNCVFSASSEPGLACTLRIDQTQGPGISGGGVFQYASADGGLVFFTDESQLTSLPPGAVGPQPGKPDLYEYDVESGTLTDRTVGVSSGADVAGFSGASEDGSRLYFVARSVLTGTQENSLGEVAQSGQPNLYLLESNGTLTFIASQPSRAAWSYEFRIRSEGPPTPNSGEPSVPATLTSPDGRYFAFNTTHGLAGGVPGTEQIFVYDSVSHALSCASCLPGGGVPPGTTALPGPIPATLNGAPGYLPRGLTDQGQLFFTTAQALLPTDTNGVADVYEYRPGGLNLLSNGGDAGPSYFFDASVDGSDVFFATTQPLVRSDTDNGLTLYDARVEGGFTEPPAPPPPCASESCRGAAPPAPSTVTPTQGGQGNVAPPKGCRRGRVKRHGHCLKKKAKHRRHHRKHQRHAHKKKHRRNDKGARR
jgi:hypothetical protein